MNVDRRKFLKAIGHTPERDQPVADTGEWVTQGDLAWQAVAEKSLPAHTRSIAGLERAPRAFWLAHRHEGVRCGWWWCSVSTFGDPSSVKWDDLGHALEVLQCEDIDPWGIEVAHLAWVFRGANWRDSENRVLAEVAGVLSSALGGPIPKIKPARLAPPRVEPGGELDALLLRFRRELAPFLERGALKRGAHRPRNEAQRAALAQADAWGWGPPVVAAALVLTGVISEEFTSVRRQMTTAMGRIKAGTKAT